MTYVQIVASSTFASNEISLVPLKVVLNVLPKFVGYGIPLAVLIFILGYFLFFRK